MPCTEQCLPLSGTSIVERGVFRRLGSFSYVHCFDVFLHLVQTGRSLSHFSFLDLQGMQTKEGLGRLADLSLTILSTDLSIFFFSLFQPLFLRSR